MAVPFSGSVPIEKLWTDYGELATAIGRRFRLTTLMFRKLEIADSRQPIVDAIKRGDAELAAEVARNHPDYFELLPVPTLGNA